MEHLFLPHYKAYGQNDKEKVMSAHDLCRFIG